MTAVRDLTAAAVAAPTRRAPRMVPYPTATGLDPRILRVAGMIALSVGAASLVVVSSWQDDSRLGAPLYWAWVLTGLQVVALWAAGRRHWWSWLLGAGVQPVWIAYAVLTGQLGFIPGCALSMAVQLQNFIADRDRVRDLAEKHRETYTPAAQLPTA